MEEVDLTPDLQFLVDQPLSAVHFVVDYVELHFDGSYLRLLTPPTVEVAGRDSTFPEAGSRDALCERIGAHVQSIRARLGKELRVEFADGARISAPLTEHGEEVIHFRNHEAGQTQWW